MTQQPHNVIDLARYRKRMAARRMAQHSIRSQQPQATTGCWQNYSHVLATSAMTYAASWPSPLAAAIGWPRGRP